MAKVVCPHAQCNRSLSVALWGLSERREEGEAKRRLRGTCIRGGGCAFYKSKDELREMAEAKAKLEPAA